MLLPSALSSGPRPRLQRFAAYSHDNIPQLSSPPITPTTPQGVDGTCLALQTVLGTRSHNSSRSPRRRNTNSTLHANARILKRPPPRTRGHLKRTRDEEPSTTDDEDLSDMESDPRQVTMSSHSPDPWVDIVSNRSASSLDAPSTPKRRRRNPNQSSIPFGLEKSDLMYMDEDEDEDEGIDVSMVGGSDLPTRPSLDEGYGSMDIAVGPEGDMFTSLKSQPRPQLGISLFAPPLDSSGGDGSSSDAMSLGTPASDMAAMVLSPGNVVTNQQPTTPEMVSGMLMVPPIVKVTDHEAEMEAEVHIQHRDPDLPTLPSGPPSKDYYFRPRPHRAPSHVHSDPVDYQPNQIATPAATASELLVSDTVYDWSHADDKALVDVVVDKLRLKKGDWDECARLLGADNGASLGRRWRELVGEGCVGLKFRYSGVGFTAEDATGREKNGNGRARGNIRRATGGREDVRKVTWR